MATLIAACLAGTAVNQSQAATQTDVVGPSRPTARAPAGTALVLRDDAQASFGADIDRSAASQTPALELDKLPIAARFTPASGPVEGIASTYDPGDASDIHAGGRRTASGEKYNPKDWSAAIRIDLRDKFGFVRGRCQSTYALVETADKHLIVKINDVGSLKPGRVIDLNIRAMRYLDPTLALGLIENVKVTPLVGNDMAPGPVEHDPPTNFAGWFV